MTQLQSCTLYSLFFFFNDTATTEIYTLSLHDALPIFVAPHFAWYYPGWTAWPYPFAYDPFYYDRLMAYLPKELPTKDMLAEALPAGVLQPGGRVSGFVYFQGIADRETRVKFEMDLVDANSSEALGHVSLPFDVKK